jgi:type I restriction enzyme S subunit
MNAERLLQHFDRLSEAPDAILRLRRFILDLAVRGKLVEQDPNDEPASELLERIQTEKARLLREGKVRQQAPLPKIAADQEPFQLPKSWAWSRLGEVIVLLSGQHLQPNEYSDNKQSGPPYVTGPADFSAKGLIISRYALVRKAVATEGQLLLTVKGAGVGKTTTCDIPEVAISRQLMALTAISWNQHFLSLTTHLLAETLKESARSLIPGISREDVELFVFGLPPLAEQHRIVAKVDELMALCDQLEAAKIEREQSRDRLVAASLHHLNPPADVEESNTPDAFRDQACFVLNHLPRLTARPEHSKQLRQTILNLAVRGQLVPQDPNDEPSSELFKRIQVEKESLVRGGKIKSQEPLADVADDEIDFVLPANWFPTRIGDLLTVIRGASPRPKGDPKFFSVERTPYHWIKISDIRKHSFGRVLYDTDEFLTEAGMQKSVLLPKGTLVMTNSATIGVPIFLGFDGGCIHDGYLAFPYFPDSEISKDFFFILFQTLQSHALKMARGMAQLNLNTGLVRNFPLGLPPLAEQHRIVAKVDELMALCDQLEAQLTTTEADSRRLLEAVLHEALAPALEETA